MRTLLDNNKKLLAFAVLTLAFSVSFFISYAAQSSARNSSVSLKADSGLFILAISDPDGLKEFSLEPRTSGNYSGGLNGCPTIFNNKNVLFKNPDDFTPLMKATITDCKGNVLELELLPPEDGVTKGKLITPAPADAASVATPAPKEEEKPAPKPTKSLEAVKYPVKELGNCGSEEECRTYCDDRSRINVCLAFAKEYGLIADDELLELEKFKKIDGGPGGCNSRASCETYCNSIDHLDECVAFADTNDVLTEEELIEAKKFQQALARGVKPPAACTNKISCETYCNNPDNIEECLAFAEEAGFIDGEELAQARKFMEFLGRGETPGNCRSREQCENYCSEDEHADECIAFADKAGFLSDEERDMIKKTGGKGPGNCRSKAQCETYCEANQEECFNWANERGFLKEEDLVQMREGMQQFREQFDKMPPEVVQCFKDTVGEETLNKMLAGEPVFSRDLGDKMKSCFENFAGSFRGPGSDDFPGDQGGGFSGPGGCTSQEECTEFCLNNVEACKNFAPQQQYPVGDPRALPSRFQGGPGGCVTEEECKAYCETHPDECQGFRPPGGESEYQTEFQTQYYRGGEECAKQGGQWTDGQCLFGPQTPIESGPNIPSPSGELQQQGVPPINFSGPGGCKTPEECQAYCTKNFTDSACQQGFAPPTIQQQSTSLPPPPPPPPTASGPYLHFVENAKTRTGAKSCVPSSLGLVSWWNGETEGGLNTSIITASDLNNKTGGMFFYGAAVRSDEFGPAFASNVLVGNPANLNFGTGQPFSLEAWFKWDSEGGSSVQNIIRKSYSPTDQYRSLLNDPNEAGYWLRVNQNTKLLEFFTGHTTDPNQPRGLIETPVSQGTWYHTVATRNSSGVMKLYLDGQLKVTKEAPNANTTSRSSFAIGASENIGFVGERFVGLIDEVSVYNKALEASEVENIFKLGRGGKCSTQPQEIQITPNYYCSTFFLLRPDPTDSSSSASKCANFAGSSSSQKYQYCMQCLQSDTTSGNLKGSLMARALGFLANLLGIR